MAELLENAISCFCFFFFFMNGEVSFAFFFFFFPAGHSHTCPEGGETQAAESRWRLVFFLSWLHISGDVCSLIRRPPPQKKRRSLTSLCRRSRNPLLRLPGRTPLDSGKICFADRLFHTKISSRHAVRACFSAGAEASPSAAPQGTSSSGARGLPSSRDLRQEVSRLLCRTSSRWKEKVLCLKTKKELSKMIVPAKNLNNLTTEL